MKLSLPILFTFICLFLSSQTYGVVSVRPSADKKEVIEKEVENSKAAWKKLSKKERKAKRKAVKSILKNAKKNKKAAAADDTVLLAIIAIFIPPLAMGLYDGITNRFWLSLLLTLLFFVPGLIYTLVVILGNK